jgi:hypothetical protein
MKDIGDVHSSSTVEKKDQAVDGRKLSRMQRGLE